MFRGIDVKLFETLIFQADQAGLEGFAGMAHIRFDGPVFLWIELLYFVFALDDHPQSRALHPPGG